MPEQTPEKFATITLDSANSDRQFPAYQLSINAMRSKDNGHGYRLMGPKYAGRSRNLRTIELKQRDADEIRGILDEVFPPEDQAPMAAWLYQRFAKRAVAWEDLSQDDQELWKHEAAAVRRVSARGGFKAQTEEQPA